MSAFNRLMELPRTGQTTADVAWHYTTRRGLESILRSDTIWASDASTMNDPQELLHGRQVVLDALARASLPGDREAAVRRHLDFAQETIDRSETFVLSASLTGDDLTQWRAYGDDTQGYAIGFRVPGEAVSLLETHPFDPTTDDNGYGDINQYVSGWREVLYDADSQAAEADELIDLMARAVDPAAYDPALAGFTFNDLLVRAYVPPGYAGLVTRFKIGHWAAEGEVRLTATALDSGRFHATAPSGRTHVTLTGWTRPTTGVSGPSTFASAHVAPLPISAVRSGPTCPYSDLRDLLDAAGYNTAQALTSAIAYRRL